MFDVYFHFVKEDSTVQLRLQHREDVHSFVQDKEDAFPTQVSFRAFFFHGYKNF